MVKAEATVNKTEEHMLWFERDKAFLCVCVWINVALGDFSLWVAMTFALPGVEEREADSDGSVNSYHIYSRPQAMWLVCQGWLYVISSSFSPTLLWVLSLPLLLFLC